MEKKLPIIPYKQIGKFCGNQKPIYYEIDKMAYLAMPTDNSFKVTPRSKICSNFNPI